MEHNYGETGVKHQAAHRVMALSTQNTLQEKKALNSTKAYCKQKKYLIQ